jgi:hypothetical protein
MEGFDPAAVDALLGLREQGLKSVVMLPLGYRDSSNDWLVKLANLGVRRKSCSPSSAKLETHGARGSQRANTPMTKFLILLTARWAL